MHRRQVLGLILSALVPGVVLADDRRGPIRPWKIKYRSKPKASIVGTTIQARNEEEAKAKLRKRFPQAIILSVDPIRKARDKR